MYRTGLNVVASTFVFALALVAMLTGMTGCEESTAPVVVVGSRITVENSLRLPIAIRINAVDVGRVEAGETRVIQRGNLEVAQLEWALIRDVAEGRPIGDSMGGLLTEPIPGDADEVTFTVDNYVGDIISGEVYFAPLITNTTSVPMEIGVNMGTDSEQRTGIRVPGGTQQAFIGYYRLGLNSNVRAYDPNVAYSPLFYVERLYDVDFNVVDLDASGAVEIVFDEPPPATSSANDAPAE